jgi:hypothetical protein
MMMQEGPHLYIQKGSMSDVELVRVVPKGDTSPMRVTQGTDNTLTLSSSVPMDRFPQ